MTVRVSGLFFIIQHLILITYLGNDSFYLHKIHLLFVATKFCQNDWNDWSPFRLAIEVIYIVIVRYTEDGSKVSRNV